VIVFGGIVGVILGLPLVALPLGVALALVLGVTVVFPPIAPAFSAPLVVMILVHALIVFIVYVVAALAQPLPAAGGGPAPVSQLELFCRGFLIGLNTSCNYVVLLVVAPLTLVFAPIVQVLATVVGVLNFLAVFPLVTNAFYQGVLGWFSLAMPMAWPGCALGLVWYIVNALFAFFFPTRVYMDWPTGGFVMEGSITGVLSVGLGYNIGSFSFITPRVAPGTLLPGSPDVTSEGVLIHETGHALNNAALGPWFGVSNVLQNTLGTIVGQGTRGTYGEMLAESHARGSNTSGRMWVDFWAPYIGPSTPAASLSGISCVGHNMRSVHAPKTEIVHV
jgi:hypothetical protein